MTMTLPTGLPSTCMIEITFENNFDLDDNGDMSCATDFSEDTLLFFPSSDFGAQQTFCGPIAPLPLTFPTNDNLNVLFFRDSMTPGATGFQFETCLVC